MQFKLINPKFTQRQIKTRTKNGFITLFMTTVRNALSSGRDAIIFCQQRQWSALPVSVARMGCTTEWDENALPTSVQECCIRSKIYRYFINVCAFINVCSQLKISFQCRLNSFTAFISSVITSWTSICYSVCDHL